VRIAIFAATIARCRPLVIAARSWIVAQCNEYSRDEIRDWIHISPLSVCYLHYSHAFTLPLKQLRSGERGVSAHICVPSDFHNCAIGARASNENYLTAENRRIDFSSRYQTIEGERKIPARNYARNYYHRHRSTLMNARATPPMDAAVRSPALQFAGLSGFI